MKMSRRRLSEGLLKNKPPETVISDLPTTAGRPADEPPAADPNTAWEDRVRQISRRQRASYFGTPAGFLIILGGIFGVWLGTSFFSPSSRLFDFYSEAPTLLIALGVAVCMISHSFDLSVANVATLVTVLSIGLRVNQHWPFPLVLFVCLGIGIGAGLLNGIVVARFHINPFIATLGTGGAFTGLADVYSKDAPVSAQAGGTQLPSWFSGLHGVGSFLEKVPWYGDWIVAVVLGLFALGVVRSKSEDYSPRRKMVYVAGVVVATAGLGVLLMDRASWLVIIVLLVALVIWIVLRFTVFGRNLAAIGGNTTAARYAGISVQRHVIGAFVVAGLLAAFAGIALAASQGSAEPGIADASLLPAYAAVFLSTVLFSPGRFHIWGTVLGGLLVTWTGQGLVQGGLNFTWQPVVNGVLLVVAVGVSTILRRAED